MPDTQHISILYKLTVTHANGARDETIYLEPQADMPGITHMVADMHFGTNGVLDGVLSKFFMGDSVITPQVDERLDWQPFDEYELPDCIYTMGEDFLREGGMRAIAYRWQTAVIWRKDIVSLMAATNSVRGIEKGVFAFRFKVLGFKTILGMSIIAAILIRAVAPL